MTYSSGQQKFRKDVHMILFRPVYAVLEREVVKMFRQRTRLMASMVRPLIWLFVIGSGVGSMMDSVDGQDYFFFLIPGVIGMTILFGAMLAALTTVYDKESGVMRMMIIAPLPHYWIVISKTLSASLASILQAIILFAILLVSGLINTDLSIPLLIIAVFLSALACSSIGMVTASLSKSLDNFAAVMNFVIFPIFFVSGSLYPIKDLPPILWHFAMVNPYTYCVNLLRHALSNDFPNKPILESEVIIDVIVLVLFIVGSITLSTYKFASESSQASLLKRVTSGSSK